MARPEAADNGGMQKITNFVMDWETRYRTNDTPWDKGTAHPMTRELAALDLPDGPILVPGCGSGWDLLDLAAVHPCRRIIGLDIAPSAVALARERTRHLPGVEIHRGDFLRDDLPAAFGLAALIWEHTCFCAISPDQRPAYAAAAARALAPGSFLAGIFFMEMDDAGKGPPWNCPEPEWRGHFGEHFHVERAGPVIITYAGREGEEWGAVLRRR